MPHGELSPSYSVISPQVRKYVTRTLLHSALAHVLLALGLTAAFLSATKLPSLPAYLALWTLMQTAYCAQAVVGKKYRYDVLRLLLALQLQTLLKIFTHLGAIYLLAHFGDYLLDNPRGPSNIPANTSAFEIIAHQVANFSKAAYAWSIVIAFWRAHQLRSGGYDLLEIARGTYAEKSEAIPAAAPAIEAALALRLQQLQFDKAPRFTRMFLESRPRVRQSSASKTSLRLTWPLCPTTVLLTVLRTEQGALVKLQCRLRTGLYRFEILPSPRETTALLNFLHTNLVESTNNEMRLANALRQQDEFKHLAIEAQLRMLQTQIEPHFLFNTLANVQQMYRENLDEGEAMLNHLTAYFRGAVEGFRSDRSTIEKEMELSQRYLAIMKARMGERLSFQFDAGAELRNHPLPPAMLISLVENAIKHGIAPNMGGSVAVRAAQVGDVVRLEVQDDGAGFSSVGGTGTGLTNLRDRLDALYGPRAWLEIDAGEHGGFKASIVLPFEGMI